MVKYFIWMIFFLNLYSEEMKMDLSTNYKNFKPGQRIKIKVGLNGPYYLYLFVLQSDGKLNLLFPNEEEPDNLILEKQITIPSELKDYEFIAGDTYGMDTIFAISSRNRIKKLHKTKYKKKSIYKNIKNSDTHWLKKLTKKSPPEQWIYSDSKIFISKDGITEIEKQNIQKETKIITTDSKKIVEEKKEIREFEKFEVYSGYFKIPEIIRKNSKKGFFQVFQYGSDFKIHIKPDPNSPIFFCEYKVNKFTKANKENLIYGNLEAKKTTCNINENDLDEKNFWTAFDEIFMEYNYKLSGNLKGSIWFLSENDKMNLKLSKLQARDEFRFLD